MLKNQKNSNNSIHIYENIRILSHYKGCLLHVVNDIKSRLKEITGAAQPKFNQAKMNAMPAPLPPLYEQKRIIELIDKNLAMQTATSQKKPSRKIFSKSKESILNNAFQGKLVPQILKEGAGHELLAKILKEKN